MTIVYCIDNIHVTGGIEHVTLMKAGALAEVKDNIVWIVYTESVPVRDGLLSSKVHTICLNINYYIDDWKSKWHVFKGFIFKRRRHRKRLSSVLHKINPDIVISVGRSEKHFLPNIPGKWKILREFHSPKNYRWLSASSRFDKIAAWFGDRLDGIQLKKYDFIVVLTHEDLEQHWKNWKNIQVIPNPVRVSSHTALLTSKRLLAVGRLTPEKNFSSLIRALCPVMEKHPDWRLDILGEGNERLLLENLIQQLSLQNNVFLQGNQTNVSAWMEDSSMLVLTSRYEGFGLVLIEGMSSGLPVIAYACPCGPKDIIKDGQDGFLVAPEDEETLSERICQLIEDETLRKTMGASARMRANDYCLDTVTEQWMTLFNHLLSKY